jgi:rubredoxin
MTRNDELTCPECGGDLKYYDKVKRIIRTKNGMSKYIEIRRLKCTKCGMIHRELSEDIFPYKQYEAEIIRGVLEDLITSDTLGFEDYPCEMTMIRWRAQKVQLLLWISVKGV